MLNSLGTFWLILFAGLFFKEKFTLEKGIGCVLVLAGVIVTNLSGNFGSEISFTGDGFLVLSTICSAFGGILTRVVTKKTDVVVATGHGLCMGGFFLLATGLLGGAKLSVVTGRGVGIMVILVLISVGAFVLYNQLLRHNPVGQVAVFNAMIPIFGTGMSCLVLGEPFHVRYIAALVLIAGGIYIVNRQKG